MRIKRIPRLGAPLYAPTLVTKPTETTPHAEAVPARPGADRHALDHKPPGVSSIARVSSTRADRARPMATQPHHPWGCWILAGRAARSRSNNLVISTTEQRAALPYQGSGHWRPKMQSAVCIYDARHARQTVQETIILLTVPTARRG